MNMMRLSSVAGAVLAAVVLSRVCLAEEAASAPAPAAQPPEAPAGQPPKMPPPALANTNAMAARQALYQEMRELSLKLRPTYEKLQADADIKAAMEEVNKAQEKYNQLRENKLRADPETAKLLDRMEAIRKDMSPQRPRNAPNMMPPGALRPMDRKPMAPTAVAPAPAPAPAAP